MKEHIKIVPAAIFLSILVAGAIAAFVSGNAQAGIAALIILGLVLAVFAFMIIKGKWISRQPLHTTQATVVAKKIVVERGDENTSDRTYYKVTFETENNLQWTFDQTVQFYNSVIEGDYGTLAYRQSKGNRVFYQEFVRKGTHGMGHSATASGSAVSPVSSPSMTGVHDMKCSNCGAHVAFDEGEETTVCHYCGAKIVLPNNKHELQYRDKFALAKSMEDLYFRVGPTAVSYSGIVGYNAMIKYYSDVEIFGGRTRSEYWLHFSRFYIHANLKGFGDGSLKLLSRQKLVDLYTVYIDNAIRYAAPEEKAAVEKEKQDTIAWLGTELQKFRENKLGCYVATCVYGSYDCPQVWMLRRFRDSRLSKSRPGRCFIKLYYAVSPSLVKIFGGTTLFQNGFRFFLDRLIIKLQSAGISAAPYEDLL